MRIIDNIILVALKSDFYDYSFLYFFSKVVVYKQKVCYNVFEFRKKNIYSQQLIFF